MKNPLKWLRWKWYIWRGKEPPPPFPLPSGVDIITESQDRIGAAGADIIGRQVGQRRNRVHIYRQPYGYPIRLCDWSGVQLEDIEELGRCQGIGGPAEPITLVTALDWRLTQGDRVCQHCKAAALGKRFSVGIDREVKGK